MMSRMNSMLFSTTHTPIQCLFAGDMSPYSQRTIDFFFLSLWIYLWLAETSQQPISQTTWLKVTPPCNHYSQRQEHRMFLLLHQSATTNSIFSYMNRFLWAGFDSRPPCLVTWRPGACSFILPRPSGLWIEETLFLPVYPFIWGLFSSHTLFAATGQQPNCSWFPFSAEHALLICQDHRVCELRKHFCCNRSTTNLFMISFLSRTIDFFFFFLSLWIYLWLAETSQQPISQTTWLKVTPNCNHCNHFWAYGFICGWPRPVSSRSAWPPIILGLPSLFLEMSVCRLMYHGISILICPNMLCAI